MKLASKKIQNLDEHMTDVVVGVLLKCFAPLNVDCVLKPTP